MNDQHSSTAAKDRAGATADRPSVSIVMPALNEQRSIERAATTAAKAAARCFADYEIIVINDGSSDGTEQKARQLMERDSRIVLVSHPSPQGFGASFNSGRIRASKDYCVMVQGDGPFSEETLVEFLSHVGEADVVCGYWANPEERGLLRRWISWAYVKLLNVLLGFRLKYYNGLQLHRTEWLHDLDFQSSGFGFQAEMLVAALRDGKSYVEVPTAYIERPEGGVTKIFKLRNILSVIRTVHRLRAVARAPSGSGLASGTQEETR